MRHKLIFSVVLGLLLISPATSYAKTVTWAGSLDITTLDPHGARDSFTLRFLGSIYEGLVAFGPNLELLPALAERVTVFDGVRYRFYLRRGVRFHNGNEFNGDDVLFSAKRAGTKGSRQATWAAKVKVAKIDDLTVEFVTKYPDSIFLKRLTQFYIMDKESSEERGASSPSRSGYADNNAVGTGSYKFVKRERGDSIILDPFRGWWGKADPHGITKFVYRRIREPAARVAALLSGEADIVSDVPPRDLSAVSKLENMDVISKAGSRVIFLGMDQSRDRLLSSNAGKNPFKDRRVREAIYRAVNIDEIRSEVMGGNATPAATIVSCLSG